MHTRLCSLKDSFERTMANFKHYIRTPRYVADGKNSRRDGICIRQVLAKCACHHEIIARPSAVGAIYVNKGRNSSTVCAPITRSDCGSVRRIIRVPRRKSRLCPSYPLQMSDSWYIVAVMVGLAVSDACPDHVRDRQTWALLFHIVHPTIFGLARRI